MRYTILVALAVALTSMEATPAEEHATSALKKDHASQPSKAAKITIPRGDNVTKKPAASMNKKKEKPTTDEEPASVKAWREADI